MSWGKKRGPLPNCSSWLFSAFLSLYIPLEVDIDLISFFEPCISDYLYTGFEAAARGSWTIIHGEPDLLQILETWIYRPKLLGSRMTTISSSKVRCSLYSSLCVFYSNRDFSFSCGSIDLDVMVKTIIGLKTWKMSWTGQDVWLD